MAKHLQSEYRPGSAPTPSGRPSHRSRRRRRFPWGVAASVLIILIALVVFLLARAGILHGAGGAYSSPSPASAVSPSSAPRSAPTPSPEPTPSPTPVPTPTPAPTPPPVYDDGTDGYMSSGILIYDNKAFELFYGSDEMAQAYAEMINGFAEELPGIHVYNMVVPNHSAFGLPDRLLNEYGCTFQHQNIEEVCRNLSPSVTPVDIFDAVNLHNDEPIYLNTDTHWSGLGAYYAYREFVRIANAGEPADLETDFEARSYPNFTGYMAYATEESVLYENPDTLTIYDPKFSYTCEMSYDGIDFYTSDTINSTYEDAGYSMFLGGDQGCVRIYNHDISTGRKLLIVKDSYGNAISPFLACNFDETHVVDFRYFQRLLPAYCEENGITDVLFFNNVMSANTSMQLDAMRLLFE